MDYIVTEYVGKSLCTIFGDVQEGFMLLNGKQQKAFCCHHNIFMKAKTKMSLQHVLVLLELGRAGRPFPSGEIIKGG